MRSVLIALLAAVSLTDCAKVIRASPEEVTISMRFVGTGTATDAANKHCRQYGKVALRVTPKGPPYDHLIKFKCVALTASDATPQPSGATGAAWTVQGVPPNVRDYAVRAAQTRGMPVGAWLAEAIVAYGWAGQGPVPPQRSYGNY